jgi:non-heme chloroperoxidase
MEAFNELRASVAVDRSQFYADLSIPFYGANRGAPKFRGPSPLALVVVDAGRDEGASDCVQPSSETDFQD